VLNDSILSKKKIDWVGMSINKGIAPYYNKCKNNLYPYLLLKNPSAYQNVLDDINEIDNTIFIYEHLIEFIKKQLSKMPITKDILRLLCINKKAGDLLFNIALQNPKIIDDLNCNFIKSQL
jgi:hypothetical protein